MLRLVIRLASRIIRMLDYVEAGCQMMRIIIRQMHTDLFRLRSRYFII